MESNDRRRPRLWAHAGERWISGTVAGEGFAAGMVWKRVADFGPTSTSAPGVVALIDDDGEIFFAEAVSNLGDAPHLIAQHPWAAEYALSPARSVADAANLLPIVLRRLLATGRKPAHEESKHGYDRRPSGARPSGRQ